MLRGKVVVGGGLLVGFAHLLVAGACALDGCGLWGKFV